MDVRDRRASLLVPFGVVVYFLTGGEPYLVLALEEHLARLDARVYVAGVGRDLEPSVAQDLERSRRLAVDSDPAAAQEVARADLTVEPVEPASRQRRTCARAGRAAIRAGRTS